jgi:hypothetical protein
VQIIGDLGSSPQGKPFWAMEPTLGKALFYGLTWVVRPIVENYYSTGQFARSLVFGLLTIFTKMIAVTLYIFGCFFVTSHFFDNMFLRITVAAALVPATGWIVLPLINVIISIILLIVAFPLDIIFPLADE